jgi:tRNA uridine 5-carboxymethylaminomethyl modification enzyme
MRIRKLASSTTISPAVANPLLERANSTSIDQPLRVVELAKRHGVGLEELFDATGVTESFIPDVLLSTELEIKYSGYFERERSQAARMREMGEFAIPGDIAYSELNSLSIEARQKLATIKPHTLAQASRIPGVSPSDIQNLVIEIEKRRGRKVPA